MKTILVTGGAGYIGSHTVQLLIKEGYQVIVLDNLSTSNGKLVPSGANFYCGDIDNLTILKGIHERHHIDAVIHFAGRSIVSESFLKPELYFYENIAKTNIFLSNLLNLGIYRIVFSSSAAVYGNPGTIENGVLSEKYIENPINPYGFSKFSIEQSLKWLGLYRGLKWISLRYFNAAGASLDGSLGEMHEPETHLIPLVLQTTLGQRKEMAIFGDDHSTPDGTCIRDYIHVIDLAKAHLAALQIINGVYSNDIYNIGSGKGYSVEEIIKTAEEITRKSIPCKVRPSRKGDPDILIANIDKAIKYLQWVPCFSGLETIIYTAWEWHKNFIVKDVDK